MKKGLFLLFLLSGCIFAQNSMPDLSREYAQTISEDDLKAHLYFLASDALEGRETGQRGQQLASLYLASQFQKMGLQPGAEDHTSFFQTFYLNQIQVEGVEMSFGKAEYEFRKDFFTFGAAGVPDSLEGSFVFGGLPGETIGEQTDIQDKLVVSLVPEPGEKGGDRRGQIREWFSQAKALRDQGAKAWFVILPDALYSRLSPYASRSSLSTEKDNKPGFPVFYLSQEMGADLLKRAKAKPEELLTQLKEGGEVPSLNFSKVKFSYDANVVRDVRASSNVLAYLEGTDKKDELLVITAHYDHLGIRGDEVYNGADDDGSGTVAVLEIAEAFAQAAREGHRPRRSILFMPVSGEEKGLLGSEFYADNPVYPLENTVADLNIDMIGRIDPDYGATADSVNYVYVIGSDKLSTELRQISEAMNEQYAGLVLDYKYDDEKDPNRFYYRSDHYNFAKNNIPVIFYFNGTHEDYHKPTDTPDKIRYGKIERIARLVFHTAWDIANREERIVVDKKE